MQSASTVCGVSFAQTPRPGQLRAIEEGFETNTGQLNIQLPTGYGKTFTAAGLYSVLHNRGDVNRLLYVVPSIAQLNQFVDDGAEDFKAAGINIGAVTDVGFTGAIAATRSRTNKSTVFAVTIQSLLKDGSTWTTINELLTNGRWMLVVDEYHHYGADKKWGERLCKLNFNFILAMSATPKRPNDDSAFGEPDIIVSYRDAVKENAVKPLQCHAYVYRIDAVLENGEIESFTTDSLAEAAGGDSPEQIEKFKAERQMRWSPKYVSPLVDTPIARMMQQRLATGYPLQVLVGALCCSHAELVYDQIRSAYPEVRVDWCGTGTNGRTSSENKKAIQGFCPPKKDGVRDPADVSVDVLIHVGMAGEGLDSVYVSEVTHLNPANINNTNNQENGRASRYLPDVTGYINVDSSSQYAKYIGAAIMDVMDDPGAAPSEEPEPDDSKNFDLDDIDYLPDEPRVQIFDMECIRVDQGEVEKMKRAYAEVGNYDLTDPECPLHEEAEMLYRKFRMREAEQNNERSIVVQWDESVERALSHVTHLAIRALTGRKSRYEKSLSGDIKRRINSRKKQVAGPKEKDVSVLKRHYDYLKVLEADIRENGVPAWLR